MAQISYLQVTIYQLLKKKSLKINNKAGENGRVPYLSPKDSQIDVFLLSERDGIQPKSSSANFKAFFWR